MLNLDLKKLASSVAFSLGAGGLGAFFSAQSVNSWYTALIKPSFTPPSWVFGPVWTVLYIMMGLSFYLIWRRLPLNKGLKIPHLVYFAQLILNTAWSAVFFGLRSIKGGTIVISALWLSIVGTMYYFRKLSRTAAWLLLPYLAWVTFAGILNYTIWRHNR